MTLEEWDRQLSGLSLEDYDREVRRRRRREAALTACEVVAWVFAFVATTLFVWWILAATPDQFSAECEALRAEMEAQGK